MSEEITQGLLRTNGTVLGTDLFTGYAPTNPPQLLRIPLDVALYGVAKKNVANTFDDSQSIIIGGGNNKGFIVNNYGTAGSDTPAFTLLGPNGISVFFQTTAAHSFGAMTGIHTTTPKGFGVTNGTEVFFRCFPVGPYAGSVSVGVDDPHSRFQTTGSVAIGETTYKEGPGTITNWDFTFAENEHCVDINNSYGSIDDTTFYPENCTAILPNHLLCIGREYKLMFIGDVAQSTVTVTPVIGGDVVLQTPGSSVTVRATQTGWYGVASFRAN